VTETALARLETSTARVAEFLAQLKAENAELKRIIQQFKDDLEGLKLANRAQCELIEQLENDRLEIRSRVEKIMTKISALERPVRESRS
jgi:arsenate reductase-like glutaredoxin family protein